jgi:hypothetical protein
MPAQEAMMTDTAQEPMRLYIWRGVFCDYTCGIAFCMAHNLEEAFSIMKVQMETWEFPQLDGDPEIHEEPFGAYLWGGG